MQLAARCTLCGSGDELVRLEPGKVHARRRDDDDQLVTDPQTQISLIWYGHKGGLEDRVFRIRTERSSVTSMPEPRTSHNISNVEILAQGGGVCELRFNWVTFS